MPVAQLAEPRSNVAPMLPLLDHEPQTFEQWKRAGWAVLAADSSRMWNIGRWWAQGEDKKWSLGERKAFVDAPDWKDAGGVKFQTCANAASVYRAFPETYLRREVLTFRHHKEVAPLRREQPEEADRVLDWCEETIATTGEPRPIRELREELQRLPERPQRGGGRTPGQGKERMIVSLEEWRVLDPARRKALLQPDLLPESHFNRQSSDGIEWAQFSWNPITGCQHTCSYCYAREIAGRYPGAFPNGFVPSLIPDRLWAPSFMEVPPEAAEDTRYKNVFAGSMADMFGRWVPKEWINAVVDSIAEAAQWNFLCLTKFPKRMAEFDIPENAWMGTTVDLQARVAAAEEAFANVGSKVRWLSCEPLIEPLRFKHLDRFNWIVIGGASRTAKTPEWRPPFDWIADLVCQARDAGLPIYMKTNLGIENRLIELPWIERSPIEAPAVFHYLKRGAAEA